MVVTALLKNFRARRAEAQTQRELRNRFELIVDELFKRSLGDYTDVTIDNGALLEGLLQAIFRDLTSVDQDAGMGLFREEYWQRIKEMKFVFSRVEDYLKYHHDFASSHRLSGCCFVFASQHEECSAVSKQCDLCRMITFLDRQRDQMERPLADGIRLCAVAGANGHGVVVMVKRSKFLVSGNLKGGRIASMKVTGIATALDWRLWGVEGDVDVDMDGAERERTFVESDAGTRMSKSVPSEDESGYESDDETGFGSGDESERKVEMGFDAIGTGLHSASWL